MRSNVAPILSVHTLLLVPITIRKQNIQIENYLFLGTEEVSEHKYRSGKYTNRKYTYVSYVNRQK